MSPMPTVLDCKLGYSLGHVAALPESPARSDLVTCIQKSAHHPKTEAGALIEQQQTGYMANATVLE